jgi:hypothetical protein
VSKYGVRTASRADLRRVSELDAAAYPGYSVDEAGLFAWWKKYPRGVYVLVEDSEVIGAVGLWPIRQSAFEQIVAGKWDEKQIGPASICPERGLRDHRFWYVGDIIFDANNRDRGAWTGKLLVLLLEALLREWRTSRHLAPTIELCAVGFEKGIPLLDNFQFSFETNSPGNLPVYTRTLTQPQLSDYYRQLKSRSTKSWTPDRQPFRVLLGALVFLLGAWVPFTPPCREWEWLQGHQNWLGLVLEELIMMAAIGWMIADTDSRRRRWIMSSVVLAVILTLPEILGGKPAASGKGDAPAGRPGIERGGNMAPHRAERGISGSAL